MNKIPIRPIDFSNPIEKTKHDKIVTLVDNMFDLQKKINNVKMEREKEIYHRQIKIFDEQINKVVYDLYELTEEEIKIIEQRN